MLTVLVADIFGNCSALQMLAKQLTDQETLIIDPYGGKIMSFSTEQLAYNYFSEQVGLNNYAQQLQEKLNVINQPFNLIAFSIGGSAVWLNMAMLAKIKVNRVVCFYASQIRYHLELHPILPIKLVVPKSEPHFDINAFTKTLSTKNNVNIEHCEYFHGFMNQRSDNYNAQGFQEYLARLQSELAH